MTNPDARSRRYRFGEFVLNPALRELRRGVDRLSPPPKVFDCIVYLIERRDRAVGRDELIAAVWGRTDVADAQLDQLMRKVRRMLGGSGEFQDVIRTIPRFGFHWAAACEIEPWPNHRLPAAPVGSPSSGTSIHLSSPVPGRWQSVVAGLILLVAVAWICGSYFLEFHNPSAATSGRGNPSAAARSARTVYAVLPVTGDVDGEAEWMRFGLMDLIAGRLRSSPLVVSPSADIIALTHNQEGNVDPTDKLKTVLGVSEVVTPTVRRGEKNWTVRLELRSANGRRSRVEAQAPDAILAARDATNRLLGIIGIVPAASSMKTLSSMELVQRVESARLVDNFTAAKELIERAPAALRELPPVQLELGRIEVSIGRSELARPRFTSILGAVSASDDALLRARALIGLGIANLNRSAEAIANFSEAIALLEGRSELTYLGDAYSGRGVAYRGAGRFDDARSDYARARIAYLSVNDTLALARIDNNEAVMDLDRGHPAEALPMLVRAAERFEQMGALDKLLSPLVNQISARIELLQPDVALAIFEGSRGKFEGLENRANRHVWMLQGAAALAINGRLREAGAILDDIARVADPEREFGVVALVQAFEADLHFESGRFEDAVISARSAMDVLSTQRGLASEHTAASTVLMRALQALDRVEEVEVEFKRFATWARGNERIPAVLAGMVEAEQAMRAGRRSQAMDMYERTLLAAQRGGTPYELARVAVSFGNALLDGGEAGRASTVVGLVGRWTNQDYACAVLQARLHRALGQREPWATALARAEALAGERSVPAAIAAPWTPFAPDSN